ncbi:hypothetical protein OESDEN_09764 [Oesophagostomum dentatum]|uniref:Preprotein translocase subunit SecG domain protein n=1 Tax=Oesophagostomum dentatum TaxID=61180 RepID=A0A0B1SZH1_OESDE|nr:hypothetical protein OESDEN_09764 [Oesophagostomum dentatum]
MLVQIRSVLLLICLFMLTLPLEACFGGAGGGGLNLGMFTPNLAALVPPSPPAVAPVEAAAPVAAAGCGCGK